jgi:polyisoprenoid-binding protein YceI
MKNKIKASIGLIILLAIIINFSAHAQDVIYRLDVKKSKLFWKSAKNQDKKAPKDQHIGFILFNSGALNYTDGNPTRGTFSINMNSMRSTEAATAAGRKKVDDELRSEKFFAVSQYPVATMVVNKILPLPDQTTFKVYGELTIKDVVKPIEFTAIMKPNGSTITATASTYISRANWNIMHQPKPTWNIFDQMKDVLINNDIPIRLYLVFTKQ